MIIQLKEYTNKQTITRAPTSFFFLFPFLNSFQAAKRFVKLETLWNKLELPPPRTTTDISIIHIVKQLYAILYQTGNKLTKRDKLGIHTHIENITLEILNNTISASFSNRQSKLISLEKTRTSLEVLKHLVRTEYELKIIDEKTYFRIEEMLIEISKMTNGWIKYLTQNPAR